MTLASQLAGAPLQPPISPGSTTLQQLINRKQRERLEIMARAVLGALDDVVAELQRRQRHLRHEVCVAAQMQPSATCVCYT